MDAVCRRVRAVVLLGAATACLGALVPTWTHAEDGKSAEEILDNLLGGDTRGIGGVRTERPAGEEQGRVAVTIHFKYNSAEITPDSFDQLRQVAAALNDKRLTAAAIRVEGHTDNTGSEAYNQWLSQRRAEAVKQYLIENEGVAAGRVEAKGYGKSHPLPGVSQDTDDGRAQNRRVELVNLGTAHADAGARPAAAAPAKLKVDVVVNYQKGSESRVLAPGGVLTPNDNYRITFTPNQESYVYVYQIDSRGNPNAVFPNAEYSPVTNPLKGKHAQSVPPPGRWLTLDRQPGEEEIVVLAAEKPLDDPAAVAKTMRRSDDDLATVRGPAPDTRADLAPELPAGMFSYRLPFKHQ
jgi:outer membrane protein OmpA-like peptidoglycan-associated protein